MHGRSIIACLRQEQVECIREIQVLSDLSSPYITKYFDSFLDQVQQSYASVCTFAGSAACQSAIACSMTSLSPQGHIYIVTEFASKGSVHDLIDKYKGQVPEDTCWKLALQVPFNYMSACWHPTRSVFHSVAVLQQNAVYRLYLGCSTCTAKVFCIGTSKA